jgi:hypothetical protein
MRLFCGCKKLHFTSLYILKAHQINEITSSEPAKEEGVVGEETWDAGDGAEPGYETSKCLWSATNVMLLIACFTCSWYAANFATC